LRAYLFLTENIAWDIITGQSCILRILVIIHTVSTPTKHLFMRHPLYI